ncbi:hypothetical protein [Streptomyces fractus]|uniref:hypothetical protein n=1 Tax=Streptomyces fractus TaxID=641806 RepID=UPI003CED100B
MRLGWIGAGHDGSVEALEAERLGRGGTVRALWVADRDPGRADRTAGRAGGRAVGRADDLFALAREGGLDGLVVAGAACGQPEHFQRAARLGLPLHPLWQLGRRHDLGVLQIREAVREDGLGRLLAVRTACAVPPGGAAQPRALLAEEADLARWITGREITEVYACGGDGPVASRSAVLTLDDGALFTATFVVGVPTRMSPAWK